MPRTRASLDLHGRTALITGAGSGIGRATALALAATGARVLVADIDEAAAVAVGEECRSRGAEAEAFTVDVSDWDAVSALATRVHDAHGPLAVLVNNAGVGMTGRIADVGIDDWRWIRSINLDGVVHGCKAFGPAMLDAGRGHVVNLSSALGYTMTATEPAYVTTKAAVLAFSRSIRADWAGKGVGVSAICPGVINTPIIRATRFMGDQAQADARGRTEKLFARGHRPELVADAIVDAIARNRAVVPVGWEAKVGWGLARFLPVAAQQRLAAQGR